MRKRTVMLRSLEIGAGVPKICVPLVAGTEKELEDALKNAMEGPFDLVEWRADFYGQVEDEKALMKALGRIREAVGERPVLFTFRTDREGGNRGILQKDYLALNRKAAQSGLVDLVDVEMFRDREAVRQLIAELHGSGVPVIGSYHDFQRTPTVEELIDRLTQMQDLNADITKIAVMPKDRMDVIRLLQASVYMEETGGDRPCVTMAMGELGMISRIGGLFSGSAITFGTAGASSAPGQLPAADLETIFRILSKNIGQLCEIHP